eukprot:4896449-Prymnesium_polylepis.2
MASEAAAAQATPAEEDLLDWLESLGRSFRQFDNCDDWLRFLDDVADGKAKPHGMSEVKPFQNAESDERDRGEVGKLFAEFWFDYGPDKSNRPRTSTGAVLEQSRFTVLHLHFEATYNEYIKARKDKGLVMWQNPAMRIVTGMNVRHSRNACSLQHTLGRQFESDEALEWETGEPCKPTSERSSEPLRALRFRKFHLDGLNHAHPGQVKAIHAKAEVDEAIKQKEAERHAAMRAKKPTNEQRRLRKVLPDEIKALQKQAEQLEVERGRNVASGQWAKWGELRTDKWDVSLSSRKLLQALQDGHRDLATTLIASYRQRGKPSCSKSSRTLRGSSAVEGDEDGAAADDGFAAQARAADEAQRARKMVQQLTQEVFGRGVDVALRAMYDCFETDVTTLRPQAKQQASKNLNLAGYRTDEDVRLGMKLAGVACVGVVVAAVLLRKYA